MKIVMTLFACQKHESAHANCSFVFTFYSSAVPVILSMGIAIPEEVVNFIKMRVNVAYFHILG